jgi:hypothetical protein
MHADFADCKMESLNDEWIPSVCVVAKSDGILSDAVLF